MGPLLFEWLARLRPAVDDPAFVAQNLKRRSDRIRTLLLLNLVLGSVPVIVGLMFDRQWRYFEIGLALVFFHLLIFAFHALGRVRLASYLLIVLALAVMLGAVLSSGGLLGGLPYFTVMPLIMATLILSPVGVLASFGLALLTVGAMYLAAAGVPQPAPNPTIQIANVLSLLGMVGAYVVYGTHSTWRAFRDAFLRAEEATRTAAALAESEARYRLIAEHSADLVALLDGGGAYSYASPSYAQVLGRAPVTLIGTPQVDLVHPDDRPAFAAQLRQAQLVGASQVVYRVAHADGGWRWVEARLSPAPSADERYLVLVARDVTARLALEQQLQQAQKMDAMGRLAGAVAHDFNNLLVVIEGSAAMAAEDLPRDHRVQADLSAVRQASGRAASLTRQLLAFARRQMITPRLVHLGELVRESEGLLTRLLPANISLQVKVGPDLWPILADAGQMQQVVMNMALNARDAMPDGGELGIVLRNTWRRGAAPDAAPLALVCMEISDTGVGMSPDEQRHLFEPFYTTKAPGKGTGLGLATCYGIVTQCGGVISVTSAPGEGTRFTVLLPRAVAGDDPRPDDDDALPLTRRATILVVEDDPAVRQMCARVLREAHYEVLEADDGEAALAVGAAFGATIDLLLTDIDLPGCDGVRLALELGRRRPGLRVLFTSGYAEYGPRVGAHPAEGVAFLAKPWRPEELQRAVRQVLDVAAAARSEP